MSGIKWMPIESNPEVMNKFLENLGVPPTWGISDVFSLDEEMLSLIPSPTLAFLLLFPITEKQCVYRLQKEEESKTAGLSSQPYFMKQTIKNACGTVALIHAVANNRDLLKMEKDSVLEKFIESTIKLNPEERGKQLEENELISDAHESSAEQGQTEAPNPDTNVDLHFVALVNVDGHLCELDGRSSVPIVHGATSAESFVQDAAKVCKDFMQRDPENLNFTILSLGPLSQ